MWETHKKTIIISAIVVAAMLALVGIQRVLDAPKNPLVGTWATFAAHEPNETYREHVLVFRDGGSLTYQKLSVVGSRSARCTSIIDCTLEGSHSCGLVEARAVVSCDTARYSVKDNTVTITHSDERTTTAEFEIKGIGGNTLFLYADGKTTHYARPKIPLIGKWETENPQTLSMIFFSDGYYAVTDIGRARSANGRYSIEGDKLTLVPISTFVVAFSSSMSVGFTVRENTLTLATADPLIFTLSKW